MERKDHPNLPAAALLAFAFGMLMLGLSLYGVHRGERIGADAIIVTVASFALAAMAAGKHRQLSAMTPAERDRYWALKGAAWRATADAHARARLGDDYDHPRKEERP
ncbi:MAG TPA: hypothetical protein VL426_06535 [Candidatus Binatia bacterium]|jgi:hypothetical protein|nr:hypothetical protein [Candidatus Binatia bacterium]